MLYTHLWETANGRFVEKKFTQRMQHSIATNHTVTNNDKVEFHDQVRVQCGFWAQKPIQLLCQTGMYTFRSSRALVVTLLTFRNLLCAPFQGPCLPTSWPTFPTTSLVDTSRPLCRLTSHYASAKALKNSRRRRFAGQSPTGRRCLFCTA